MHLSYRPFVIEMQTRIRGSVALNPEQQSEGVGIEVLCVICKRAEDGKH